MINVAIIGCGRISGHHCQSILDLDVFNLTAVCDLDENKVRAFGERFSTKPYINYHAMLLDNPEIDLVVIASPSGMHYSHTRDVIVRYRKNVVVEKPTFMKPSQVNSIYELANHLGVKIFPVFQNRHNLAVCRVLEGIKNGELGEIRSAAIRVRWCRTQKYYDLAPWRGTFSMDGGCLTNQGIHHIDLLKLIGGQIKRVAAHNKTFGAKIEVEDTASAIFEFANGGIGTLEITTAARPHDYEASLSLVCDRGLAQIGGIAVNELQIYSPDPTACLKNTEDFSGNVYGNGHAKIYLEIYQALTINNTFSVTPNDVYETIKLLNMIYLSDEKGCWVDINSNEESSRLGVYDARLHKMYETELIN